MMEVETIAGELRASIRRWRTSASRLARPAAQNHGVLDSSSEADLILLRSNYDVAHAPFSSHRPLLGRFIMFIKNIVRELLVQLLERQTSYNAAAARLLKHLDRKLDRIVQEQQRLERRLEALETRITSQAVRSAARASTGGVLERLDGLDSRQLSHPIDAAEEALDRAASKLRKQA
jgi:hypothetical protein